jgi:hypothetical protein
LRRELSLMQGKMLDALAELLIALDMNEDTRQIAFRDFAEESSSI